MAVQRPATVACLLLVIALASAACPGGWSHWDVGNKCYRLTAGLFNAYGCAAACISLGVSTTDAFQPSTLACISSSAESDFVTTLTSGLAADKSAYSKYVWIGHHQSPGSVEPGGGWDTCASGERANFTNWGEGQPDDTHDDGAAGINAGGFLRWPTTAHCAVIGQPCYAIGDTACAYDKWYDLPCYFAYPCLCELGSPASAEYLSSVGADIEEGLQQLRKGVAILYGAIIPALWLVPAFLRACFRLASRKPLLDKAADMIDPREKKTLESLEDAEKNGKRLRFRVSSTLAQLGWMLLVLGLAQTIFMVYIIDITPVAGASMCYLAAVPWGFAFQGLALRPTDEGAIRIACAVGFLTFFFICLLLAWLAVEDGSLIVTAGQALAAAACAICTVLLSTTMSMRFVCRNKEQFKAVAIRLQAIQRGKTAPHEVNKAKKAYDLEAAKNAGSKEASSAHYALEKAEEREKAANSHLELLKELKELTSEEQQKQQAIVLCTKYLGKLHTEAAAALKELTEHIEVSQVKSGRLKAIQNTSKQTRSVSGSAASGDVQYEPGKIVCFQSLPEGFDRHTLREKLGGVDKGCSFVEMVPEMPLAYARFASADQASAALKVEGVGEPKLLEGEDERQYWEKIAAGSHERDKGGKGGGKKLVSKLLGLFGIDANEAFVAIEAFCGRSGGEAGGEAVAIQSTLTARDITSFKDFADAYRIRVLTMLPLNLWFAFRLAIIGKVVYYRKKKSCEIMWTKPPDVEAAEARAKARDKARDLKLKTDQEKGGAEKAAAAEAGEWMEFTLEYTMAPRRQLRRLWLVLRLFFSVGALFCFAIFISTVLYLPIDPSGPNPFALWILLGANLLAAALVFTRANRGRVVAWLGTLGKTDDADNKAAALAALVGSLSAAKAFKLGIDNFRKLDLDKLTEEEIAGRKAGTVAGDWKTSPGWPTLELYNKTSQAKFGQVDAFISHSWSDNGVAKFKRLQEWKNEELKKAKDKKEDKKDVTIWLDKACLNQRDIQASLAGLPVFISGCKNLLVLAGDTYASRLWCVIELFVFVQLGRNVKENMIVKLLSVSDTGPEPKLTEPEQNQNQSDTSDLQNQNQNLQNQNRTRTRATQTAEPDLQNQDQTAEPDLQNQNQTAEPDLQNQNQTAEPDLQNQNQTAEHLLNFDAGKAETFDPNDRQRLLAVIEASFGTFDPFNKIIRATAPTAKLDASSPSGSLIPLKQNPGSSLTLNSGGSLVLTPTFTNGMDVTITSDDGSKPISIYESGRPSTVTPTKSTTKYTLTVVSPNGIKVSKWVMINVVETPTNVETPTPASSEKPNLLKQVSSLVKQVSSLAKQVSSRVRLINQVHPAPSEATVADTAATDTKADSKDERGREHVVTLSP
jgi:hypothetical protein